MFCVLTIILMIKLFTLFLSTSFRVAFVCLCQVLRTLSIEEDYNGQILFLNHFLCLVFRSYLRCKPFSMGIKSHISRP